MSTTHLLYLHGFRSSPHSAKAQQTARRIEQLRTAGTPVHWWCPQLPPSPREAIGSLLQGLADWPLEQTALIGSSLGGFYATVLAERLGCQAALLNPAVAPARDLAAYIGEIQSWHSEERFFFQPAYVDELRTLTPGPLTRPERYFAVIAQGDEVLDWREMHARYAGSRIRLLEGGDHALSDYEQHLDEVLQFLGLC